MAFGAALYAALVAPVLAYFAKNAVRLAIDVAPPLLFLAIFAVEWATDDVWSKCQLVAVVVSAVAVTLKLTGHINPAAQTK